MKNAIYILPLLCLVAPMFLTGCEDEAVPANDIRRPTVRVILRGNDVQTRVTYDPDESVKNTMFVEGDIVGAFAVNKNPNNTFTPLVNDEIGIACVNLQYEVIGIDTDFGGGALSPVMSQDLLPYDGENSRYIFRYPFCEGTEFRNVTHAVETDQSTESLYGRSDLMWSCTPAVYAGRNYIVSVEMEHAMSHILLNIDASLVKEHMASVLNVHYIATGIDLTTEDASSGEDKDQDTEDVKLDYGTTGHTAEIKMWCANSSNISDAGTLHFRALVPAQTIPAGTPFLQIITSDGPRVYSLNNDLTLIQGVEHLFNVTASASTNSTDAATRALSAEESTDGNTYYIALQEFE